MKLTNSSQKNYIVQICLVEYSENGEKTESMVSTHKDNHTGANAFLSSLGLGERSKYSFKNGCIMDLKGKGLTQFQTKHVVLSYEVEQIETSQMNSSVALCCASRALFYTLKSCELSTTDIAKQTGLSVSDVSNIRSGKRHFTFERAAKIANDLDLIVYFLKNYESEIKGYLHSVLDVKLDKKSAKGKQMTFL
jgi:transcriptional regulator with XRE-family HTH domain